MKIAMTDVNIIILIIVSFRAQKIWRKIVTETVLLKVRMK